MDRLTCTGAENEAEMICRYEDCHEDEEHCPLTNDAECQCFKEVLGRLKAYEDTRLTPEQILEIDRMYRELCEQLDKLQAEQQSHEDEIR